MLAHVPAGPQALCMRSRTCSGPQGGAGCMTGMRRHVISRLTATDQGVGGFFVCFLQSQEHRGEIRELGARRGRRAG